MLGTLIAYAPGKIDNLSKDGEGIFVVVTVALIPPRILGGLILHLSTLGE